MRKNEAELRQLLNQRVLEYEKDHLLIKENEKVFEEKDKYISQLESQIEQQKIYSQNLIQVR